MRAASTAATKKRAHRGRAARDFELKSAWSYPTLAHWLAEASLTFYLTAAVLVGSLVLGGGTRSGFLSDAFLQLLTLPVLLYFLWRLFARPLPQQLKVALSFCLALVALPLLQLVPLPPWLWTIFQNADASSAFEITGQAVPWMPTQRLAAGNVARVALAHPAPRCVSRRGSAVVSRETMAKPRTHRRRDRQRVLGFDSSGARSGKWAALF